MAVFNPPESYSRRRLLQLAAGLGIAGVGAPLLAACGADNTPGVAASTNASPDPEVAKREGKLVVWHNDQEPDNVKLLAEFTKKTGIEATEQKIAPSEALTKLQLEARAGASSVDVFMSSPDVHYQLQQSNALLQYSAPSIGVYDPSFKSNPNGFWTAYFVNVTPMVFIPTDVPADVAPKRYEDLLDPRWKDQIVFPPPTSATGFNFWFMLRDILPADYWDKLAAQRPKGFPSSTAMQAELTNRNKKIAGSMSVFAVTKAIRAKEPLTFAADPRGIPTSLNSIAIMKSSKRPNAAKMFTDYLLSEEGQKFWNGMQGSYSAYPGIVVPELPDIKTLKLLTATDFTKYGNPATRKEFETLWSRVLGLA
ncbi:MAG: iron(III) transport system substrate-binding protein [Micromonosporaceae bacterium]|jgi:iron(III) transport system substrate-binding protein|nr:iron(III) transport system substrate-binding protein [Micromonosporaceae bacterium]